MACDIAVFDDSYYDVINDTEKHVFPDCDLTLLYNYYVFNLSRYGDLVNIFPDIIYFSD